MSRLFHFSILMLLLLGITSYKPFEDSYDIEAIYKGVTSQDGLKVLINDDLKDAQLLLVPTKIDQGKYNIILSRVARDLYKVYDKNIYIKTRSCYESADRKEVLVDVESNFGYSRGKIYFKLLKFVR